MKRPNVISDFNFALSVFLFFIVFFFNFQQARSEDKTNNSNSKQAPTKIKSNIIDIKRKLQIIDFLGNVVVEKEDSSMLADKMRVFYEEQQQKESDKTNISKEESENSDEPKKEVKVDLSKNPKKLKKNKDSSNMENSSIKRIDAVGNVKIFTAEYVANGDFGYYDPKNNIFILEKNVTVNNGTSVASGNKFIYDITTKKGNFIGQKDQIVKKENPKSGDSRVVIVIGNDLKDQRQTSKSND